MSKSKKLQLLLTKGEDQAVVAILSRECYPNELGNIVPPVMVEHEGIEFIFKKRWMESVFLYEPAKRIPLDDLVDS
jgi:hypothetical protein